MSVLKDIIKDIDLVCLMSVNPGFGGQSFIKYIRQGYELKTIINKAKASTIIEIDGGVTNKNAKALIDCGADVLVAGSYVFSLADPIDTIAKLKKI